jgi:hyperosmotically inducible protein
LLRIGVVTVRPDAPLLRRACNYRAAGRARFRTGHPQHPSPEEKIMHTKLAGTLVLLGALSLPVLVSAEDMSSDTTGEYLDDAGITTRVKANFAQDKWVKGRDISVRTDHGVVDLTGTVGSTKESDRATELAAKIKSVKAVHNNLKISAN